MEAIGANCAAAAATAMDAFLKQIADQILISEDGLARLYAIKGPLSGALAGCKEAIHLETGKRSAVREASFQELSRSRRKRDELHSAVVAMRHIANLHHTGSASSGHDASSSSPLALLTEVVATTSRVLVFVELEPLMRHDGGLVIDMLALIEKRGRIKEDDTKQIFAKLVLVVKAAHDLGIVLRNIKPETIQVGREGGGVVRTNLRRALCLHPVRAPHVSHGLSSVDAHTEFGLPCSQPHSRPLPDPPPLAVCCCSSCPRR